MKEHSERTESSCHNPYFIQRPHSRTNLDMLLNFFPPMQHPASLDSSAVSGRADLVWDVDPALGRKTSDQAVIDTGDAGGSTFQALAGGLAVGCGPGHSIEGLDPAAAGWWNRPASAPSIRDAWSERTRHLTTRDSGFGGNGSGHKCNREHGAGKLEEAGASHDVLDQ